MSAVLVFVGTAMVACGLAGNYVSVCGRDTVRSMPFDWIAFGGCGLIYCAGTLG